MTTLLFAGWRGGEQGGCPANLPSRGATLIRAKGDGHNIDKASLSHTHTRLYKKPRPCWAACSSDQRGQWRGSRGGKHTVALNSHHLHPEGRWQRLKQLDIPPSAAPTPTSQPPRPPQHHWDSATKHNDFLFFTSGCSSSSSSSSSPTGSTFKLYSFNKIHNMGHTFVFL